MELRLTCRAAATSFGNVLELFKNISHQCLRFRQKSIPTRVYGVAKEAVARHLHPHHAGHNHSGVNPHADSQVVAW